MKRNQFSFMVFCLLSLRSSDTHPNVLTDTTKEKPHGEWFYL